MQEQGSDALACDSELDPPRLAAGSMRMQDGAGPRAVNAWIVRAELQRYLRTQSRGVCHHTLPAGFESSLEPHGNESRPLESFEIKRIPVGGGDPSTILVGSFTAREFVTVSFARDGHSLGLLYNWTVVGSFDRWEWSHCMSWFWSESFQVHTREHPGLEVNYVKTEDR